MVLSEQPPDCQSLADFVRTELQEFYRTLRFSRDHQRITQAAERLRLALSRVERVVTNPTQRYDWSRDQQWSFVSLYAYVQEAKQELKSFVRHHT